MAEGSLVLLCTSKMSSDVFSASWIIFLAEIICEKGTPSGSIHILALSVEHLIKVKQILALVCRT